jgi:hypothetical protein
MTFWVATPAWCEESVHFISDMFLGAPHRLVAGILDLQMCDIVTPAPDAKVWLGRSQRVYVTSLSA